MPKVLAEKQLVELLNCFGQDGDGESYSYIAPVIVPDDWTYPVDIEDTWEYEIHG